jgi:putative transposase
MYLPEHGLYHIYNRGNNREPIFFGEADYLHFNSLCQKHIANRCQIIAWCLMPNHFHFLINADAASLEPMIWGGNKMPALSNGFQLLQSSYAKSTNYKGNRTGSLFQQKTKAKSIEDRDHAITAFWYLHQNPVKAGLVRNMWDWEYSSYQDYCGIREDSLCNVALGKTILNLTEIDFRKMAENELIEADIDEIY